MKSKLNYLTGVSLKRKIKTKWFLAANILIAAIIIAGVNIDRIITAFGGDFNEKTTIYVMDKTKEATDIFKSQLIDTSKTFQLEDKAETKEVESDFIVKTSDKELDEIKKEVKEEKNTVAIVFENDDKNVLKASLISKDYLSATDIQMLTAAVNSTKYALATLRSNISMEELA